VPRLGASFSLFRHRRSGDWPFLPQRRSRRAYVRALAAGYKASFLCSDIFNAGMTEAQVERDDLQRGYPSSTRCCPP
jgi:hypothetical protein